MSNNKEYGVIPVLSHIDEVRRNWGWFLAFGILLLILGIIAITSSTTATLFSIYLLGVLLIAGGIGQIISSFYARKWSGLFLMLFIGILYLVTGILCLTRPEASAISLTLLIAAFCLMGGAIRMVYSIVERFDEWGWVFFNGLVTFILGVLIIAEWPISGLWVIGLFIGIDLLFAGWTWIALSFAARKSLP